MLNVPECNGILSTACNAECLGQGDMRCFGPDRDECCSFYDPHDGGKCLNECGSERMITEIFDCAGMYM